VRVSIAGYIASVRVTQQYENPYDEKIEAIYVFPLPQDAAVNEFLMTIGDRRIRGIIREREEAERIYTEAKHQGYVASLLTQERPNIFTQSVANIEPGKAIDVELVYFNPLVYADGEYEFVFPTVVGPRFNPPGHGDGIGAVPRGQYGASGQATEVHYLRPEERSGHDIALAIDIDAGMPIEGLTSPTHSIDTKYVSHNQRRVTLSDRDTIPNRDFVLRYRVAGDTTKTALLTHRDERSGFFTLMLQPPDTLNAASRMPMELVFVLDCSGSMEGAPLAIAKQAAERALRRLGPDDTFQIIQFSMSASQLGNAPVPATPANIARGIEYLHSLDSEGGTMMTEGIKAALDFPHDPRRLRVVSFMTDGYIGNEAEILGEIHRRVGAARIFSFGIGSSTNRYLLDQMALAGRGAVAYVGLDEESQRAVDAFYERVSHPALTNLEIDWNGMAVRDVYPARLPDLFVGRPVIVTGRFTGTLPSTIAVYGRAGGEPHRLSVPLGSSADDDRPALASIWARMKIADLEDRATFSDEPRIDSQIRDVALNYGLMSAYTAFVAVDSSTRTAGSHGTTVAVPVPVPKGVPYDTTVPEEEAAAIH
jgi:Ca-activated chloride channel family protein